MLNLLSQNSSMKVSDLSEQLDFSTMTIRRDLDMLEQNGMVERFHGGAALVKTDNDQASFKERVSLGHYEKSCIGREAANYVTPGSVVFFGPGTTPLAVIKHISDDVEFTGVTTGLLTAVALCNKPKANVIHIGGTIHPSSLSSIHSITMEFSTKFHANIAFLSTKSFVPSQGTYEALLPLIEIKKTAAEVSDQVILLVDHSKFVNRSMCKALSSDEIDLVITDSQIDPTFVRQMEENDISYIIAEEI